MAEQITVTNAKWELPGCLSIEVNGKRAHIPVDKIWWAQAGYVVITINPEHGIELPEHTFPANPRKGISEVTLSNCVPSPKLARYVLELRQALEAGTWAPGQVIDPGPIEIST